MTDILGSRASFANPFHQADRWTSLLSGSKLAEHRNLGLYPVSMLAQEHGSNPFRCKSLEFRCFCNEALAVIEENLRTACIVLDFDLEKYPREMFELK